MVKDMLRNKVIWAVMVVFVACVAFGIWDSATCTKRGPAQKQWVILSCGDNCFTATERDYRECLERK